MYVIFSGWSVDALFEAITVDKELLQDGPGTEPELETGTFRTFFFEKPKEEPETSEPFFRTEPRQRPKG